MFNSGMGFAPKDCLRLLGILTPVRRHEYASHTKILARSAFPPNGCPVGQIHVTIIELSPAFIRGFASKPRLRASTLTRLTRPVNTAATK